LYTGMSTETLVLLMTEKGDDSRFEAPAIQDV
jgi:hypothetical protein